MKLKKLILSFGAAMLAMPTSLLAGYDYNYGNSYPNYVGDSNYYDNNNNSYYSGSYQSYSQDSSAYYQNSNGGYSSPYDYYGLIQPTTYGSNAYSKYYGGNYNNTYSNSANYNYPKVNCTPDYKYNGNYSDYHSYADDDYYRNYYNNYTNENYGKDYNNPNYYYSNSKAADMPVIVVVFINQEDPSQHFSMRNHQPGQSAIPVIKVVLDSSYYNNLTNSLNQNPATVVININLGTGVVGHDNNGNYSSGYYGDAWVN